MTRIVWLASVGAFCGAALLLAGPGAGWASQAGAGTTCERVGTPTELCTVEGSAAVRVLAGRYLLVALWPSPTHQEPHPHTQIVMYTFADSVPTDLARVISTAHAERAEHHLYLADRADPRYAVLLRAPWDDTIATRYRGARVVGGSTAAAYAFGQSTDFTHDEIGRLAPCASTTPKCYEADGRRIGFP